MSKSFFESKKWKQTMNFTYGMGAAVVIIGALFKILHWTGADLMLMIGLFTEAGIFCISAFEPVHMDVDWSLVYPELAGGDSITGEKKKSLGISQQLDVMLAEAKIGPDLIQSLGSGLQSLSINVKDIASLSSAAVATSEFASTTNKATKNMEEISKSTAMVSDSLSSFTGGLSSVLNNLISTESATSEFANTTNKATKNMEEISKSTAMVSDSLSSFTGGLSSMLNNLTSTESAAIDFKEELGKLNRNLGSLNTVYGNMLGAMSGSK